MVGYDFVRKLLRVVSFCSRGGRQCSKKSARTRTRTRTEGKRKAWRTSSRRCARSSGRTGSAAPSAASRSRTWRPFRRWAGQSQCSMGVCCCSATSLQASSLARPVAPGPIGGARHNPDFSAFANSPAPDNGFTRNDSSPPSAPVAPERKNRKERKKDSLLPPGARSSNHVVPPGLPHLHCLPALFPPAAQPDHRRPRAVRLPEAMEQPRGSQDGTLLVIPPAPPLPPPHPLCMQCRWLLTRHMRRSSFDSHLQHHHGQFVPSEMLTPVAGPQL